MSDKTNELGCDDASTLDFAAEKQLRDSVKAAFDSSGPSDELLQRTLAAMNAASAARDQACEPAPTNAQKQANILAQAKKGASSGTTKQTSTKSASAGKGGKAKKNVFARQLVAACLTACLVMGLGGGVAFASEAASVDVTVASDQQDVASASACITLKVNRFGRVIGAQANDELGQQLLDGHPTFAADCSELVAQLAEQGSLSGEVAVNVQGEDILYAVDLAESCNNVCEQKRVETHCLANGSHVGYGAGNGSGQGSGNGSGNGSGHSAEAGHGSGSGSGQGAGSGHGNAHNDD